MIHDTSYRLNARQKRLLERHPITSLLDFNIGEMAYRGPEVVQRPTTVQPAPLLYRFLQNRERVCVWLLESKNLRLEGVIAGFDQFMNMVMDEAAELHHVAQKAYAEGRYKDALNSLLKERR